MKFLCIGLFVISTFLNWSKVDGNVTKLIEDVTDTSETTQPVTSSSAKLAKKTRKELDNMHPEVHKKRSNVDLQARRSDKTNNLDRDNEKASMTDEHGEGENNRRSFGENPDGKEFETLRNIFGLTDQRETLADNDKLLNDPEHPQNVHIDLRERSVFPNSVYSVYPNSNSQMINKLYRYNSYFNSKDGNDDSFHDDPHNSYEAPNEFRSSSYLDYLNSKSPLDNTGYRGSISSYGNEESFNDDPYNSYEVRNYFRNYFPYSAALNSENILADKLFERYIPYLNLIIRNYDSYNSRKRREYPNLGTENERSSN
ncbi:uncharacterized protein LOC123296707 [Chrysoperla carnea]|uniref:uncharacterized protein LOC123296707 n=1 Tax=Chrysoperla carnea TaxID=189513 RepID=UPI001D06480B|nr:uncharacterized protein LOC123296707 [Chrysoperla carnea]